LTANPVNCKRLYQLSLASLRSR